MGIGGLNWLWTLRGSRSLRGDMPEQLALDRFAQLFRAGGKTVSRGADEVRFRDEQGPLVSNQKPLVMFERGWVRIDRSGAKPRLRYELRQLHGLIFCLFAGVIFAGGFMLLGQPGMGIRYGLGGPALLYGLNWLISAIAVPRLFGRVLDPRIDAKRLR